VQCFQSCPACSASYPLQCTVRNKHKGLLSGPYTQSKCSAPTHSPQKPKAGCSHSTVLLCLVVACASNLTNSNGGTAASFDSALVKRLLHTCDLRSRGDPSAVQSLPKAKAAHQECCCLATINCYCLATTNHQKDPYITAALNTTICNIDSSNDTELHPARA
jgi:hypothetical protein